MIIIVKTFARLESGVQNPFEMVDKNNELAKHEFSVVNISNNVEEGQIFLSNHEKLLSFSVKGELNSNGSGDIILFLSSIYLSLYKSIINHVESSKRSKSKLVANNAKKEAKDKAKYNTGKANQIVLFPKENQYRFSDKKMIEIILHKDSEYTEEIKKDAALDPNAESDPTKSNVIKNRVNMAIKKGFYYLQNHYKHIFNCNIKTKLTKEQSEDILDKKSSAEINAHIGKLDIFFQYIEKILKIAAIQNIANMTNKYAHYLDIVENIKIGATTIKSWNSTHPWTRFNDICKENNVHHEMGNFVQITTNLLIT